MIKKLNIEYRCDVLIIALFLIIPQSYCQSAIKSDSLHLTKIRADSSTDFHNDKTIDSLTMRLQQTNNLLWLRLLSSELIISKSEIDNHQGFIYSHILSDPFNYNPTDKFSAFKQNLSLSYSYMYHEMTKYDLGIIGYYLGVSKTLFAIILAILSL